MSSSSAAEEENYWPGYVDALTTMTMVLTFIMMVLGVVVFTLSQELSRKNVSAIAKAMGIEVGQGPSAGKGSAEGLTAAILEAIAERSRPVPEKAPPENAPPKPVERLPVDLPPVVELEDVQTSLAGKRADEAGAPAPTVRTPDVIAAKTVQNERTHDLAVRSKDTQALAQDKAFIVRFKDKAIQVDAATVAQLQDFAKNYLQSPLEIRGMASASSVTITEARRTAYFRAMGIRGALTKLGVPPAQIKVRVVDTDTSEEADTVAVFPTDPSR